MHVGLVKQLHFDQNHKQFNTLKTESNIISFKLSSYRAGNALLAGLETNQIIPYREIITCVQYVSEVK
jgi:hypothetical protein